MNLVYNPHNLKISIQFKYSKSLIYIENEKIEFYDDWTRYSFKNDNYFVKIDSLRNKNHTWKEVWYKHCLSEYYLWRKYEDKHFVPILAAGYVGKRFFVVNPYYQFKKMDEEEFTDRQLEKSDQLSEKYGLTDGFQFGVYKNKVWVYDYAHNAEFKHIRLGYNYNEETGEEL